MGKNLSEEIKEIREVACYLLSAMRFIPPEQQEAYLSFRDLYHDMRKRALKLGDKGHWPFHTLPEQVGLVQWILDDPYMYN